MANHRWEQFQTTPEKGVVWLFPCVAFNGSSAPTLQAWNPVTRTYAASGSGGVRGILSVVRNSIGNYTITLQDTYQRLLGADITFIGSAAAAAPLMQVLVASNPNATAATTAQGLGTAANAVNVTFFSAQNTLADPAATELGIIWLTLQNSAAY